MSYSVDRIEIVAMFEQFQSLATCVLKSDNTEKTGAITRETFRKSLGSLGSTENLIIKQMFRFFDKNNDGFIDFQEMVHGVSTLSRGTFQERTSACFSGYDLNNDGLITKDEFRKLLKAYFRLSMELVRDVVKVLQDGIMQNFDDESLHPVSAAFPPPPSLVAADTTIVTELNLGGTSIPWDTENIESFDNIPELASENTQSSIVAVGTVTGNLEKNINNAEFLFGNTENIIVDPATGIKTSAFSATESHIQIIENNITEAEKNFNDAKIASGKPEITIITSYQDTGSVERTIIASYLDLGNSNRTSTASDIVSENTVANG